MNRQTENKIILILKKTRLDELVFRFNTQDQARFYVEHLGADFSDYQMEDTIYKQAVRKVQNILSQDGRLQTLDLAFVPNFIFGKNDTVIALGQDGLVANILKYLDGQLGFRLPVLFSQRAMAEQNIKGRNYIRKNYTGNTAGSCITYAGERSNLQ